MTNFGSIKSELKKLQDSKKNIDKIDNLEIETELFILRILNEVERDMKDSEVTKSALAKLIGVSAPYISNIFSGIKRPNIENLVAMSLAFNKKLDVRTVSNIEVSRSHREEKNSDQSIFEPPRNLKFYEDKVPMVSCGVNHGDTEYITNFG